MKKLTALAAIILSLSSYAYAENLSAENKAFIEAIIKKEFPTAKYDKQDKKWRIREDDSDYAITTDFKHINTPEGKIAGLVINKELGMAGAANVYLYELKRSNNKWNIQTQATGADLDTEEFVLGLGNGGVIKLGNHKLGFALTSFSYGSGGTDSADDLIYSVNGEYKHLAGCVSINYDEDQPGLECDYKVRKDLPETNGFYPIEFSYSVFKYKITEANSDLPRALLPPPKLIGKRKSKVIAKFDSTKQAYVLPVGFVKAFKSNDRQETLWNYFKK